MSKHQNIFLVGMPGAGKSTVGKALAKFLGMPFYDTDAEIVRRNGVEITTIFEIEGEQGFRQREAMLIGELTQKNGVVMATGGGAILRAENRELLTARGIVVYLRANIDALVQRTNQDGGGKNMRPLFDNTNVRERITSLLEIREPLYNEMADLTINANRTSRLRFVQELAAEITEFVAQSDRAN